MSIRLKLTTTAIAVILVANSLLSFITLQYLSHVWMGEVQTRVQRNLNSARAAYQKQLDVIAAYLRGAERSRSLTAIVQRHDPAELGAALGDLQASGPMDFVNVLDPSGKVICRARNAHKGDDLSGDPVVARVLRDHHIASGTVILSPTRLMAEGSDLAERARFELVPTTAAQPTEDQIRCDGMVISVAVPVLDAQGRTLAILYGGNMLNRRYEMVDAIKEQVYPHQGYDGKDYGAVTIFQGDLRISTNLRLDDGSRAVGTRLNAAVCDEVLGRGGTWAGSVIAVNDWYITAYEPIRDPGGQIVGVLSMGLLQAPFTHQRNVISAVFLIVVVGATLASLVLLLLSYERLFRPIRDVVAMAQKVIGGDLSARVGMRPSGEMGVLCWAVDSMAQAMAERQELLEQVTRQQIGRSEQLASVGRLAAGVAHEINNPLTGVLAFAGLLREKPNMDEQDRQDLELIVRETKRAREIVRGLLDFARETPSIKAHLKINDVAVQTVRLLGKRDAFQDIEVVEDFDENIPCINGDKNQLEQVLVNLSLNACEAMPGGGTLLLSTSYTDGWVEVKVTDTGCGIKKEHLDKIFEPFFTTKPVGKGTGLGLAVSYGIVQQHEGTLEVESEERKGTTFTIRLPAVRDGRV
ncbi:MAG: ATP-binding protein [Thermoguttaceae bacterium]